MAWKSPRNSLAGLVSRFQKQTNGPYFKPIDGPMDAICPGNNHRLDTHKRWEERYPTWIQTLKLPSIQMKSDRLLTMILSWSFFASVRAHHVVTNMRKKTHECPFGDRQQKGHRPAMNPQSLRSIQKMVSAFFIKPWMIGLKINPTTTFVVKPMPCSTI